MTNSNIQEKFRKDYKPYPFELNSVDLQFDFDVKSCLVTSQLEFSKKPDAEANQDLVLDGQELELVSLALGGVKLSRSSYREVDNQLIIPDVPNEFTLSVQVKIKPHKNTSLNGLYLSNHKYCTQCEAEGFRRITYYPDRPDVLSRFTTRIEAEKKEFPYLLSNGELIEHGALDDGRHFAKWVDPHPKPSYLFALVAGDFDLLQDSYETTSGNKVALEIYVDKGKIDQCDFAMRSLIESMRWDEQTYGLEYDLNRYMIVAVGDFNMGAMENKGLNVFNTAYVLANDKTATDTDFQGVEAVIGHEYFHNYTGNRVTCRDWFQLSLKEGLTVFREQQFSGDMNSESIQRIDDVKTLRAFQFPEDAGPMSHPIRPDSYIEMNNFYTHTVYIKGAEVIRMMETILGPQKFNEGVRHYLQKHDGQAVTCEDFVIAMEDVSNKDLSQFRLWYSQAGTPELNIRHSLNNERGRWQLEIEQSCAPTPGQPNKASFYIPLKLSVFDENGQALPLYELRSKDDVHIDISEDGKEAVVLLSEQRHVLYLDNIYTPLVPSLLRGFSAPVNLSYPFQLDECLHLLAHDDDPYVCWQTNQQIIKSVVDKLLSSPDRDQQTLDKLIEPLVASRKVFLEKGIEDPAFFALQLELPSLSYLMESYRPIPIADLLEIWPMIQASVSNALQTELVDALDVAQAQMKKNITDRQWQSSWRRFFTTVCQLMAYSKSIPVLQQICDFYAQFNNMTIRQRLLCVITHYYPEHSKNYLEDFYDAWQDEELVIDKWFSFQATQGDDSCYEQMLELLEHPDFSMTNPNKVRSLIGAFARSNPTQFHHETGRGYAFVAKQVIKLNKTNPQLAARTCGAFNGWRSLECKQRQKLIKAQLKKILETENLSADVFEIANKALL